MSRKKSTIILSEWKGITTLRSKPASTKQTANTKEAGKLFGMAASRSKIFRELLAPILPEPKNRVIINRLQKSFYQWLKAGALDELNPTDNISFFEGLSFNENIELKQRINIPFTAERLLAGGIKFCVPAFDPVLQVKAPAETKKLQLQLAAATMNINNAAGQDFFIKDWFVDYVPGILPANEFVIPIDAAAGKLVMVVFALKYLTGMQKIVDELTWKPAGIVASFYN